MSTENAPAATSGVPMPVSTAIHFTGATWPSMSTSSAAATSAASLSPNARASASSMRPSWLASIPRRSDAPGISPKNTVYASRTRSPSGVSLR